MPEWLVIAMFVVLFVSVYVLGQENLETRRELLELKRELKSEGDS